MPDYPAEITPDRWTTAPAERPGPRPRLEEPDEPGPDRRRAGEGAEHPDRRPRQRRHPRHGRFAAKARDRRRRTTPDDATIRVKGCGGEIPAAEADLYVGNSGTSLRFLTALVATGRGTYRLDGNPRMRQRPVADLLQALNGLGADCKSDLGTGCPPVTVKTGGLDGGYAFVKGDVSSQFLSGLLMALPGSNHLTTVEVEGTLVSLPYVTMTLAVMEAFGVRVGNRKNRRFDVHPGHYTGRPYAIEPDASAASYFFALAAITGGTVTVEGLGTDERPGRHGVRRRPGAHGLHASSGRPTRRPSPAARSGGSTST